MGGSTATATNMRTASGAHEQETKTRGVHKSTNVSSAMERDISKPTVATLTNAAMRDKSVTYQTTTPIVPIPLAPQTSGPSDGRKDVEWGVMSQETSRHVTKRGNSPLLSYNSLYLAHMT